MNEKTFVLHDHGYDGYSWKEFDSGCEALLHIEELIKEEVASINDFKVVHGHKLKVVAVEHVIKIKFDASTT